MPYHFNNFAKILIFVILFTTICEIQNKKKEKKEKPKTIVQANHFYSQTNKYAKYDINNIQVGKSLIMLLKKSSEVQQKAVRIFKVHLAEGDHITDCNFKKNTDLCIIPKVEKTNLQMRIQCLELPCEVSWVIYQPQIKVAVGNQIAQNLYYLNNSNIHLIGQITCNDPSITSFHKDVTVYSIQQYKKIYKDNILYILFNNQEKGYVFIDIAPKSKSCAQISFNQVSTIIKLNDNTITDFISKGSSSVYELQKYPDSQFRIQASLTRLDKLEARASIFINVYGLTAQGQQEQVLSNQLRDFSSLKTNDDFTYIFKKPAAKYNKLKIQFTVEKNHVFLINFNIVTKIPPSLDIGQKVYFDLNQGQTLDFIIQKNPQANDIEKKYLTPLIPEEIKLSLNSCLAKEECKLTVSALKKTSNMIYISQSQILSTYIDGEGKGTYLFQSIQFLTINNQLKHKIRSGQNVYLKKNIKKDSSMTFTINNPNVIMYAACKSKCFVPNAQCRERTGNLHHPFVYQAKEDCQFRINVQGLDSGQFVLTIIDQKQQLLTLQNSVPFSYTMDKNQQRLDFIFKMKKKQNINFNLISPIKSLKLMVLNKGKGTPDDDNSQVSTEGTIFIEQDDIKELSFIISVVKLNKQQDKQSFTHFTIVVTTESSSIKLEPTVISYENLQPSNSRNFIFQFDPSQNYFLNFYVYNLKQQIDLNLKISDNAAFKDPYDIKINKEIDYIDINEYSLDLCEEQGADNCEIFLRITNAMDIQVDFSVTLIVQNAIVELKDGIWQAFSQAMITSSTHFYFYPRHYSKSILIYYHMTNKNLGISYNLWRYDSNKINPIQWPFDSKPDKNQLLNKEYKHNNYIQIDHQKMKKHCEPNCVVLINIYRKNENEQKDYASQSQETFHIMASNSQIELPQKHRLNFNINSHEDKNLLIDLKYAMSKQTLTFYSSIVQGSCYLKANLISNQISVCPNIQQEQGLLADYQIQWGQYEILIQSIKQKLKQKEMDPNNNNYLCVTVHSQRVCKASLQYTSQNVVYKSINQDTYQDISLAEKQEKIYMVPGYIKIFAKITRMKGFPFVAITKCSKNMLINQCVQNFKANKTTGKQLVSKMQTFTEQACDSCSYLFKFTTVEPATLSFHLQSQYSEIQLKQDQILTDFINEGQTSRYMIHAQLNKDLTINIHVQEGMIQAEVSNLKTINLVKESTKDNKLIHYSIKSVIDQTQTGGKSLYNPLDMTTDFMIFHLSIKSLTPSQAASFTILYSTGERNIILQDGVILDYLLETKQPHFFYYYNELSSKHIYLSISMPNSIALNKLEFTVYTMENPNDKDNKTQALIQKPTVTKKNVNPTILLKLPEANYFVIQMTNPTSKDEKIIMGINHQQVILLPFDHDFPFLLHKGQSINILVDVNIQGFIDLQIRKCESSQPSFGYTFDYTNFLNKQFMYQTKLNDDPFFKYTIKAQRIGTLYIHFEADPDYDSTLTIKAYHNDNKKKASLLKPGKRGVLTYEIMSNDLVQIKIPVVECGEPVCKGVKYFYFVSTNQQQLYSQLYCSSTFFQSDQVIKSTTIPLHKIETRQMNKMINLQYTMRQSYAFLGVKAVASDGQEAYYKPIQIATLYGKWSKVNIGYQILMVGLIGACICFLAVFVRVASRKGYQPLEELNDQR